MYRPILTSLSVAALLACLQPSGAHAQVTSNLDDLPSGKPTAVAKPAVPSQTTHRAAATPSPSRSTAPHSASAPTGTGKTTVPAVPATPPPPVVLPPPFVPIQTHAPAPPVDIKAVADAKSSTTALPEGGLRVIFAPSSSDLTDESLKALTAYGASLKDQPEKRIILTAYATVPGDDISMPRRISLARALAVRSIFINAGVATTRLYPRAMGRPDKGDVNPADRLDIVTEQNPPPSDSATPANGTP
ncbi:OmpA family protein [Gluconobacter sp. GP1]|uniref:OmpA family protein n=1 Tax=Gluconobacter sp. GP1 TaxID=3046423 RepID=UPI00293F1123|nr:OmpA family protein [Gluconobacter sp. GP1]